MGKLIKNHLARLITLTAATFHLASTIEAFFWPKIFWDFLTKNLDGAVKPIPYLQIVSIVFIIFTLALEYPLKPLTRTGLHASIEARLMILPFGAVLAALLYQGTNPAGYYLIATAVYFWGFCDGEVVCAEPWTLPKRKVVWPRPIDSV